MRPEHVARPASDVRSSHRKSDEDEETYRKPMTSSAAAVRAEMTETATAQRLTSGVVSVVSEEDEEGAEETRVQAQPPNFAELERSFVPVGAVERDPETNRKPNAGASEAAYGDDESVTQFGSPVEAYGDDSVTAEGRPVARPKPIAPADDAESLTKRKRERALPKLTSQEDEDSSIRATAVIASPLSAEERMPMAAPPPAVLPRSVIGGMRVGAGVAASRAELFDTISDSGLRLSRDEFQTGERGTLGLEHPPVPRPDAAFPGPPSLAAARLPRDLAPPAYGFDPAYAHPNPNAPNGPSRSTEGGPPAGYDLRVIVVALVSFAVPFGLFLYLYYLFEQSQGSNETPREPGVITSEPTPRDDAPRGRAPKPTSESQRRH